MNGKNELNSLLVIFGFILIIASIVFGAMQYKIGEMIISMAGGLILLLMGKTIK